MKEKIEWFLGSNDLLARLLRTVLEAVLGVLLANVDVLFSGFSIPVEIKTLIVGLIVAVVSPILALLRKKHEQDEQGKSETEGLTN